MPLFMMSIELILVKKALFTVFTTKQPVSEQALEAFDLTEREIDESVERYHDRGDVQVERRL
jgi:hypothetical protein